MCKPTRKCSAFCRPPVSQQLFQAGAAALGGKYFLQAKIHQLVFGRKKYQRVGLACKWRQLDCNTNSGYGDTVSNHPAHAFLFSSVVWVCCCCPYCFALNSWAYQLRHGIFLTHPKHKSAVLRDATCLMNIQITRRETVKYFLRKVPFFFCRWCISPPHLLQQRHRPKQNPTRGIRKTKSSPRTAQIIIPIS